MDGCRESTQSWRELLLDLKHRGLGHAPDLAVGEGALGFWSALREVFGSTTEQRCRFHKTGNVLNAMPKSVQAKAKGHLHDIWQAETKAEANAAFAVFVKTYGLKYDKAIAKLIRDREALLAFHGLRPFVHVNGLPDHSSLREPFQTPGGTLHAHPNHQSNRKPCAFARHRTGKTKGCRSRKTGRAMAFKLMIPAPGKWRKLDGSNRMPEIIQGVAFIDGIKQPQPAA